MVTINQMCKCIITDPNQLVSGDRGPSSSYEISIEEGDFKAELEVVWDSEPLRVSQMSTDNGHNYAINLEDACLISHMLIYMYQVCMCLAFKR